MELASIASGSSGNCIYIGNQSSHFLVDAGISKKRIVEGLSHLEISPEKIDGIFVTHEHMDHISGLGVFLRKYPVPVYATARTIDRILATKSLGKINPELFTSICPDQPMTVGNVRVEASSIYHDAADPVSYVLENHCVKIGMVTDLGVYDEDTVEHLKDSDLLYVEANHDIRMLQAGPYPYYLKQRILGSRGHLCNEKAGSLIRELCSDRLKNVILGHLSKENNYPQLALETVKLEFRDFWESGKKTGLSVAPRSEASELVVL